MTSFTSLTKFYSLIAKNFLSTMKHSNLKHRILNTTTSAYLDIDIYYMMLIPCITPATIIYGNW